MPTATHHLFNSSESLSDDVLSSDDLFHDSSNTTPNPSTVNLPSNTTLPFKQILKAPDTNQYSDRTRHPSQNQSTLTTSKERNTKTHYNLRQQPQMDYRLFILPSKL